MRAYRIVVLTIAAGLLALTGCSRQQPQTAGPSSNAPGPAVTAKAVERPAASEQQIQVKSVGKNAQIVHTVKPGTVVVWNSSMEFYIHFLQGEDFCEEAQVPRYSGFYAATKNQPPGSGATTFRFQCTVKRDVLRSHEFAYEILGKLPLKPPPPGLLLRTTPCGGCVEDTTDSGN